MKPIKVKAIKLKVKCPYCGEPRVMKLCAADDTINYSICTCRCTKCNKWFIIRDVYGQPEVTKG